MKTIIAFTTFLSLAVLIGTKAWSQDAQAIREVLNKQSKAWNNGNIEEFMEGYWKNDSLMFIGKKGINWGWKNTLENYKHSYPDTVAMGKLSFTIIVIKKLSTGYYYVVGKWLLTRTVGDLTGHFDLLFKKISGRWLIIADHSS